MKFTTATAVAALVAAANADLDSQQVGELNALFVDINDYRDQYVTFLAEASGFSFPTGLINIYTEITSYTNDDYTTLFATIPAEEFSQIEELATVLPWYSSRLEPAMESAVAAAPASSGSASVSASAPVSSASASVSASGSAAGSAEPASSSVALSALLAAANSSSVTAAPSGFTNATSSSSASLTSVTGTPKNSTTSTAASSSSKGDAANNIPSVLTGLSLGASLLAYVLL